MEADDGRENVPQRLRETIEHDLRPVRPLAGPFRRAALFIPVAAVFLVGVPWVFGLRPDVPLMGPAVSWGLSGLQVLAGIFVLGLALKESVPGNALSPRVLIASAVAAIALVVVVTEVTFAVSPTIAPPPLRAPFLRFCAGFSTLVGTPLVLLAGFLAARALPLRPWVAGGLYGLAAGLIADAGWRLFCEVSSPGHVLVAHGAGVGSLALIGMLGAVVTERVRWGRRDRRE